MNVALRCGRKCFGLESCAIAGTCPWCRAVRDVRSSRMAQEWRESEPERESLLESISGALLEIFTSHNEVPFIAMHRKQVNISG